MARFRAASDSLQEHFHDICDSGMPSSKLATCLFSAKLISEPVFKKVTDDQTGSESYTRIQEMMKAVKSILKLKQDNKKDTFGTFLDVLSKDTIGKTLANKLKKSYRGYLARYESNTFEKTLPPLQTASKTSTPVAKKDSSIEMLSTDDLPAVTSSLSKAENSSKSIAIHYCDLKPADIHQPPPPSLPQFCQNVNKLNIRSYQRELAEPGINGENYIICAPTGSGKTLVAAMIIENHMIKLRERGHNRGNILFIVKTQQLAHQQQKTLTEYLKGLSITEITGETESSIYLALPQVDIVVCTSGKLCSELDNNMIHLRSATLLVFDECHHAIGGDTYALILEYYLLAKQEGTHLQVIGLTASPGAGRGKYPTLEKVLDHQTNLCARLDATSGFKCVQKYENELKFFVNSPNHFSHALPQRSYTDPFIEEIVKVMNELETMLPLPSLPTYYRGSSAYQQWVINEIEAAQLSGMDGQRKQISILELLHEYAMSLITYEDFEIDNALEILNDACNSTDENCLNETEIKLKEIHLRLRCNLALLETIPNPLLITSEDILYQHFSSKPNSKGLFFVRAIKHTEYVVNWIQSSRKLSTVIKPGSIFGHSRKAGMSKEEQIHTLDKFRRGDFNLLITTSVLEEGLDVPDCNLVIRFQILSNEIADVQAEGRARSKDSTMHTIVVSESYMHHNQLINNDKKDLALHGVKLLSRSPINQLDIASCQQIFLTKREYRLKAEEAKNIWNTEDVEGHCRKCGIFAFNANIVCKYGTNVSSPSYVISSKCFIEQRMKKKERSGPQPATVGDYTRPYKIACVKCDDEWGVWGCWKNGVHFPVLKCKSFTFVNKITRDRISPKQWKKVPFRVLSYEEYNEQDSN